jgi:thiol-disulfide isomerase/thioredoxin
MRSIFSSLVLVFIFICSGYGQNKLTISPENVKPRQTIHIQYFPDAPGATIPDTVSRVEIKFTYSNFYELPWVMPLSKSGDHWETSFTIPRYGVLATFIVQSGEFKDQPEPNKHYKIVVYDDNNKRVKNSYLYEGYSISAQAAKSTGVVEKQAALYKEELAHFPDNYEAKLRLLNYQIQKADEKNKPALRKKAEDIIAAKFRENPGNMNTMNRTTMGYLIIGENSRLDSIRNVVKEKYPNTEAGYELIIGDLQDNPDTTEMVKGLLNLVKKENQQNRKYLISAHENLFKYYASKKQTEKALYHLQKIGRDSTPYQPLTLKNQAQVLFENGIALDKAFELAQRSLALADTFPIGIIRYFPETGFMPSYADRETRKKSTQKARGNLYSLMALIKQKQGEKTEAGKLMEKALAASQDEETLANAGNFYQENKDFENAFNSFKKIATDHPEDTGAIAKMKTNYADWKGNENGLENELQQLKDHWMEEMKIELQKEIVKISLPAFLNNIVDLKGNPVPADMLKNKIVVLDFWATWCVPCMHEMPYLQKAYENYKSDSNVVFMVINSGAKNALSDAQGWWGNKKFSFPVYYNTDREIGDKLGFNLIPATFIIDSNNNIRFKTVGFEGPVIERKIPAAIELLKKEQ